MFSLDGSVAAPGGRSFRDRERERGGELASNAATGRARRGEARASDAGRRAAAGDGGGGDQAARGERERVAVNVAAIYRELDGGPLMEAIEAFAAMARLL